MDYHFTFFKNYAGKTAKLSKSYDNVQKNGHHLYYNYYI